MKFYFLFVGIFSVMVNGNPLFGQSRLINRTEVDLIIHNEEGTEIARVPKRTNFDLSPLKRQLMIVVTSGIEINGQKPHAYIQNTNSETCHIIYGPIENIYGPIAEAYSFGYRSFSFRDEEIPCREIK